MLIFRIRWLLKICHVNISLCVYCQSLGRVKLCSFTFTILVSCIIACNRCYTSVGEDLSYAVIICYIDISAPSITISCTTVNCAVEASPSRYPCTPLPVKVVTIPSRVILRMRTWSATQTGFHACRVRYRQDRRIRLYFPRRLQNPLQNPSSQGTHLACNSPHPPVLRIR
jgi:hypothetical protein